MSFTIGNYNININLTDDILFVKVVDTISFATYQESFNNNSKENYDLLINYLQNNNIQINKTNNSLTLINQNFELNISEINEIDIMFDKLCDIVNKCDKSTEIIINNVKDDLVELKNDVIEIKENFKKLHSNINYLINQDISLPILIKEIGNSNHYERMYSSPSVIYESSNCTVLDIKLTVRNSDNSQYNHEDENLCKKIKENNVIYIQPNYYLNITEISKMKNLKYLSVSTNDRNNYKPCLMLYHNYSYTNVFDINTISHLPLELLILEAIRFSLDGIVKIVTLKKLIINIRREYRPDIFENISKIPNVECIIKNWHGNINQQDILSENSNMIYIHANQGSMFKLKNVKFI